MNSVDTYCPPSETEEDRQEALGAWYYYREDTDGVWTYTIGDYGGNEKIMVIVEE